MPASTRQEQIELLLDHYQSPRHRGTLPDADVAMPGGNPGCGDIVTIYLQGAADHDHIADVRFEGAGCTISQAAASMLMEQVHERGLTMPQVLALDYNAMIDALGREVVATRPRCATLALGTLKAAVKKYLWDHGLVPEDARGRSGDGEPAGLVFGEAAQPPSRPGG